MLMHMPMGLKKLVVPRPVQASHTHVHMQAVKVTLPVLAVLAAAESAWMSAVD